MGRGTERELSEVLNSRLDNIESLVSSMSEQQSKVAPIEGSVALSLVSTQDSNDRTTNATYTRVLEGTLQKTIDYSNFDINNKPQLVVTKLYLEDGVTLDFTNTSTLVWSTDGMKIVSFSEVIS